MNDIFLSMTLQQRDIDAGFGQYLYVSVSQEDIDTGHCGIPSSCALAKAILRLPHVEYASVGTKDATVGAGRLRVRYKLSGPSRKFIRNFDNAGQVEPSRFRLTFIESYLPT